MSLDLLNELEKRVQSAVSTIEDLKFEIEQLKEENAALSSEKNAWEGRLAELLGKFDLIDSADTATASEPESSYDEEQSAAFDEDQDIAFENDQDAAFEAEEETLANQAFEQDFAEATDASEQDNTPGSSNGM